MFFDDVGSDRDVRFFRTTDLGVFFISVSSMSERTLVG